MIDHRYRKDRRREHRRRPRLESLEVRALLAAWNPIGPAPIVSGQTAGGLSVSGRVTAVAPDPVDPNTIFIAAAGGGVWKTTDGGSSWTPLTDNLTYVGTPVPDFMGAVAETRSVFHNEVVYAGTGEANYSIDSFYGEGILVSQDGGTTWTVTTAGGAFSGATVSKIAIDPSDRTGGTAYAAVAGFGVNGTDGNDGIWKTTNFGATWTNTTAALPNSPTFNQWTDVAIDPHTPSTVYAAAGNPIGADGNGIYKSTDSGATWSLLTGPGSVSGAQAGRIALAVFDNGTTQELFASIAVPVFLPNGGALYAMLKSTNGGATFSTLSIPNYLGQQGWYDTTLIVSPTNPNYVYAGGQMNDQGPTFDGSPLESFNGGATWVDIATDAAGNGPHTDFHGVGFDAAGNLIDGDDGGVYKLTNPTSQANQRWSSLNTNLQITQFTGIAVDPTTPSVAYGGSQDNGTSEYTGGPGWTLIQGGDGGITRLDPTDHLRLYQEFTGVSIQRSDDGGATFTDITPGIAANTSDFYVPYVLDSSGDLLYGTDYLNYSTNQGNTWTQIGTPGVHNFNPFDAPIDAIAVSPANKNVVWVSAGGEMFVTQNATASPASVTWTEHDLPDGRTATAPNSIAFDPTDPTGGTAYAVVNAFTGSGADHVFKTTNFGATWTSISNGMPDTPADSIALSPDGKTLYVGTDVGVYTANNVGFMWSRFGTGMPNAQVVELELVPSLNILAAGTHGRGMWEIPLNLAPIGRPIIASVSPTSAVEGGPSFVLTVTGASFTTNSKVLWNGSPLATTFITGTILNATVPAADIAEEGTASVVVSDPSGGSSNPVPYTITDPAVIATGGQRIAAVAGVNTGPVLLATFTDPGGPEPIGDYSADIYWGDGTGVQIGGGTIVRNGSTFQVFDSHTYAAVSGPQYPGSQPYLITITIHHELAPNATAISTATVSGPSGGGAGGPLSVYGGVGGAAGAGADGGDAYAAALAAIADGGPAGALTDPAALEEIAVSLTASAGSSGDTKPKAS
jgi:hypothetical protein